MKRLITMAFCGILLSLSVENMTYAQTASPTASSGADFKKVGAAGGQLLKMGIGARAGGMAGAFSGVADDISGLFWNSASIVQYKGVEADFAYANWFGGFSHNFMAISLPIGENYAAALSMTSFTSGDIPVTTDLQPNGTGSYYNVSDFIIGLTLGGRLTEQFSFGFTGKYIQQGFASESSSGVAFDIGTLYATGIQGIKLGFSISNLGNQLQYGGQDLITNFSPTSGALNSRNLDANVIANAYQIPLAFRAGLSTNVLEGDAQNKLLVAVDFETLSDTPEQFALGAEYTWQDFIALRGGYRGGSDQFDVSGGLGLKYEGGNFKGKIDYSATHTKNFGILHRISVGIGL